MHQPSILSFFGKNDNSKHKESKKKDEIPLKNARKRKPDEGNIENENLAKLPKLVSETITTSLEIDKSVDIVPVSEYSPLKEKYNIVNDACWHKNEKVPFLALATTFNVIESISGRLQKIEAYTNYMRSVIYLSPNDWLASVYLCLNRVAPEYSGVELNVGESFVIKALSQATGVGLDRIKQKNKTVGDLGQIAADIKNNQTFLKKPETLTVENVFAKFKEISEISGKSAQNIKVNKVKDLLLAAKNIERKYIIRGLLGKLGIQFGEQSVLTALGNAITLTPPDEVNQSRKWKFDAVMTDSMKERSSEAASIIKKAFCECPNYDLILEKLLVHGIDDLLKHCSINPGVPVKPMLAQPSKGVGEVFKRFDESQFTCEYKYDGERAQIHVWTDSNNNVQVKIFSRNQEDNTTKYPDLISMMKQKLSDKPLGFSCILDSEAVAWDRETQSIRPFQELSTRKRKDVKEEDIKIQVCVYAFDIIFFNGHTLTGKNLRERRDILHSNFTEEPGKFNFATSLDSSDIETIQEFLEQSIKDKCEGLMVKTLDENANYEISKRSKQWLKLKKDYLDSIGDSVDLVVIGAYYGSGKRANKFGAYLMACYDPESEYFQAICKLGTGFKDTDLDEMNSKVTDLILARADGGNVQYGVTDKNKPDVYIKPTLVWEVKAADLSLSPDYLAACGLVDRDRGISLRFPRYLRSRDDKKPEDATNSKQIAQLYRSQDQVKDSLNSITAQFEEDEFY